MVSVAQSGVATLTGQFGITHACASGISRCFAYDSLSRLTWATNPESGTISYGYDALGNPLSKTDARSITTTLGYDQLSRLRTKSYNDSTPAVTYNYGTATTTCPSPLTGTSYAIGRLISVSNSVSTYSYDCYDGLGRLLHGAQTTGTAAYPFTYGYNAAGSVASMTWVKLTLRSQLSPTDVASIQASQLLVKSRGGTQDHTATVYPPELQGGCSLELPACFVISSHRTGTDVVDPAM